MSDSSKHKIRSIALPLIFSVPTLYYCIKSGLMMKRLESTPECPGFDKHGKPMNVAHMWLVMAKYVFSTTLILAVLNIVFGIVNAITGAFVKASDGLHSIAGLLCFGNVIFIPCVIFANYSRDCVGHTDPANPKHLIINGPLG